MKAEKVVLGQRGNVRGGMLIGGYEAGCGGGQVIVGPVEYPGSDSHHTGIFAGGIIPGSGG